MYGTRDGGKPRTEPLRVCLVGPSRGLGGQAIQAERLRRSLEYLPNVEVALLPVDPALPAPLGILQRIRYVRTVVTQFAYLAKLLRWVRRYDVIHAFSASYVSFLLAPTPAVLVARLYRKRAILNYRSGEAEDHLSKWRQTTRPVLRMAHELVVPSQYLVEVFRRFGLEARRIPNLAGLDQFTFRERWVLRPVFVANRNFEAHYNVGCVLDAFSLIQAEVPDAELLLAGEGTERAALEERAETLGVQRVTFLGSVPEADMPALLDRADVYLNGSNVDNMPTSLLEAFAAGLPVVSTRAGGIPYMVRHEETGLLVPCGDPRSLAQHALRLLREPDLVQRLVRNAHHECRTRYAWESVQKQWLQLYRGSEPGPARPASTPDGLPERPSVKNPSVDDAAG